MRVKITMQFEWEQDARSLDGARESNERMSKLLQELVAYASEEGTTYPSAFLGVARAEEEQP